MGIFSSLVTGGADCDNAFIEEFLK